MSSQPATIKLNIGNRDYSICVSNLQVVVMLLIIIAMLFTARNAVAAEHASELNCSSDTVQKQYSSSGACTSPDDIFPGTMPEGALQLLFSRQNAEEGQKVVQQEIGVDSGKTSQASKKIIVYFFWGNGCPHCEEERRYLDEWKRVYPALEIRDFEVWYNKKNAGMMAAMLQAQGLKSSGVPVTFIGDRVFSGFTEQTRSSLTKQLKKCREMSCGDPGDLLRKIAPPEQTAPAKPFAAATSAKAQQTDKDTSVIIPYLGELDARTFSLPLLTLIIAGMDSFNPCAFFVLLTLLGLLVHARSRKKMLLIGGTFVFFSGFIYFLFMAAWLNLFLVMGHVAVITTIAGSVSLVIAGINIKDFFLFKQGVSLTIADSAKLKLFDRMRKLLRSSSLTSIMIGAIVLAVTANFYELLCTAGFPMVFTRILTLNNLSPANYYLYLVLYNIVYVVPMAIIVLGFTYTLGKRQLTEWQGRVLKLVSGTMMLGLGAILIINPALLNSVLVSFIILAASVGGSLLVAIVAKKTGILRKNA